MARQVFINLPVQDVERSKAFYEALGFTYNPMFSDKHTAGLSWSDEIAIMLLERDHFQSFIQGKTVADTATQVAALNALTFDTREEVQAFADTAKANGGDYYRISTDIPEDQMFGYEVTDPDGNHWEPVWMNFG